MSEKLTYNVIFKEKNSFGLFQKSPMAATFQPLYVMPHSRVKVYELTDDEVEALRNSPHVKAVEPTKDRFIGVPEDDWKQTGRWNRGQMNDLTGSGPGENNNNTNKNWALWRCYTGANQPPNASNQYWGFSEARLASDRTEYSTITDTIEVLASGKNVDIVICDSGHVAPHLFELQKNADGSGGSRVIEYNWNQHYGEIIGQPGVTAPPTDYSSTKWGDHGSLCAAHAAGNTQGWAREANIYTFSYQYDWSDPVPSPMSYIAAFHRNKPINPVTGRKNPTIVNNSWSYRMPWQSVWDYVTELWDTEGTRLIPARTQKEAMTFHSPCIVGASLLQDPYIPYINTNAYWKPLPALKNKLLDGPGEFSEFCKYEITTTNDLTGSKCISVPDGWGPNLYDPRPFIKTIYRTTGLASVTASRSFIVQGPCQIDFYSSLNLRNMSMTGTMNWEIKIYKGSELIETITGTPGFYVDISAHKDFIENQQYTVTYKITDVSAPADSGVNENGHFVVTNKDFTCVKTPDYHGDAETLLLDREIQPGFALPSDFNWTWFDISIGRNGRGQDIVADEHGIKFGIKDSGLTAFFGYDAPRVVLGRTSWEDADYYSYQVDHSDWSITGAAGSRIVKLRIRYSQNLNYSIQDWNGKKYTQRIYTIYEDRPNYLEIEIGNNTQYIAPIGSYRKNDFKSLGMIQNAISLQYDTVLTDYEDGIADGVINCGAAGNNKNLIACANTPENKNKVLIVREDQGVNGYFSAAPAVTPGAAGGIDKNITVGAIENSSYERIAYFSARGPAVGIFAPGVAMWGPALESSYNHLTDPRSTPTNTQYMQLGNGTSFASPTVCGIMALIAEKFPYFTQKEMKEYIEKSAGKNQILDTEYSTNDPWGQWLLRNSKNNYLRYKEEREKTGTVSPAVKRNNRPTSGVLYPRRRGGKK